MQTSPSRPKALTVRSESLFRTLNCLETLGDARLGRILTTTITREFPAISLSLRRSYQALMASNETLQRLVPKRGVKGSDLRSFSKQVGNSFEVFL
ncbi:hypothetical protein C8R44DRAFT_212026 [Mycena epipterygia]|nr:hypothetical protein C8R44DRAFT_212026 [Mycena epipterygia]